MIFENGLFFVYIHLNKINGKMYIGMSQRDDPNKRWKNGKGYDYNWHFKSAIEKFGWNNFEHIVFASKSTEQEASNMEKLLIDRFQTYDRRFGYNFAEGGYNNRGLKGELNPFWHKRPEKAIEASVKARKGKHLSDEQKEKIRQGNIKAGRNAASIAALEACRHNKRPNMKGANNPKSTAVRCVETGVVYASQLIAEHEMNLPRGSVYQSVKCKIRAKGYHFERV